MLYIHDFYDFMMIIANNFDDFFGDNSNIGHTIRDLYNNVDALNVKRWLEIIDTKIKEAMKKEDIDENSNVKKKIHLNSKENLIFRLKKGQITENDIEGLAQLFVYGIIDKEDLRAINNIKLRNDIIDEAISIHINSMKDETNQDDDIDEDLTNLPPMTDKQMKQLGSPIPISKKQREIEMSKPGSFQRYGGGQFINKIVKEEIDKLFENKAFRIKLRKKHKANKMCPECQMPENACKHRDYSGPQGAKTLLDQEITQHFRMHEVAIVKDKKGNKNTITKDSLGGISCDCAHPLNESLNVPCKHIQAYLMKEQHLTILGPYVKEDPKRYNMQNVSQKLKEKKQFDSWELKTGTKEEMEHTSSPKVARKIALTHLKEDPNYYKKLKKVGLVKEQPKPQREPSRPEPETIPEPDTPYEPEPKKWDPFRPDADPSISPQPKARKKYHGR